jgi:hypothetical protein
MSDQTPDNVVPFPGEDHPESAQEAPQAAEPTPTGDSPAPDPTVGGAPEEASAPAVSSPSPSAAEAAPAVQPVFVDQYARRSDDDALENSFVQILSGDHAGQVGAVIKVEARGDDGYPTRVIVRLKDTAYEGAPENSHGLVSEPYANVRTVRGY